MTRSFAKDRSSRSKAAFSSDVFKKKPKANSRKVRTPPAYYRSKAVQQLHGEESKSPKELKPKKR